MSVKTLPVCFSAKRGKRAQRPASGRGYVCMPAGSGGLWGWVVRHASSDRLGLWVRLYARRFRRAVGLGGQRCQVTSLVVAVAVQPRWWAIVWWRPQSSAPLSRLVWPPSAQ